METYQADSTIYEISVKRISKDRKEQFDWVKLREPYPDEQTHFKLKEEKEKDPQFDHRRIVREVESREEIYNQKVHNLDIEALIIIVNQIGEKK